MKTLMLFLSSLIIGLVLVKPINQTGDNLRLLDKSDTNEFVRKWDSLTKLSLVQSNKLDTSKIGKEIYKSRYDGFDYVGYFSDSIKATVSIRQLFYRQVLEEYIKNHHEFIILEETKYGEFIQTNNYLLILNNQKISSFYCFSFSNEGRWLQISHKKTIDLVVPTCLPCEKTTFGYGRNLYEWIFTKVNKGDILFSEFFLRSTVSQKSQLNNLKELCPF